MTSFPDKPWGIELSATSCNYQSVFSEVLKNLGSYCNCDEATKDIIACALQIAHWANVDDHKCYMAGYEQGKRDAMRAATGDAS